MDQKRKEMREEFLKLSPLQRIMKMNAVFNDMIALKAETEGVHEYEIYQRYLDHRNQHKEKLLESRRGSQEEPEDKDLLL